MAVYLIGDTHFYHSKIIEYCSRPFRNVEEMNQVLITNWNHCIGLNDVVYHLGDVVLVKKECLNEIVAKLNGKKYLIRGNHDRDISDEDFKVAGFIEVSHDPVILPSIILSHYPIMSISGLLNVHGHTHNTDPGRKYPFYDDRTHKCISVEMTDYKPVSLKSILEEIDNGSQKEK